MFKGIESSYHHHFMYWMFHIFSGFHIFDVEIYYLCSLKCNIRLKLLPVTKGSLSVIAQNLSLVTTLLMNLRF